MAITFKMKSFSLTASAATLLTVPSGKVYIIIGMQVSNIDGANAADVSLSTVDSNNANKEAYLCKTVSVPADAAFVPIDGKLVLCAGDSLKGLASAADDLEVTVSWMEKNA